MSDEHTDLAIFDDAQAEERIRRVWHERKLTDEWRERGADERGDFARLTDTLLTVCSTGVTIWHVVVAR